MHTEIYTFKRNKLRKPKTVKTHPSCNERNEACLSVKKKTTKQNKAKIKNKQAKTKTKRRSKCQDLLSFKEAMDDLIRKQENIDMGTENKDRQRRKPSNFFFPRKVELWKNTKEPPA